MSENAERVVKNTFFLSIANTLPRLTQAVVIFIAARTLGDVGLGKYYTIASLVSLTNLFTDLGLTSSFTKEVSMNKKEANKYFFNILLVKIFLGFLSYFSLILITYLLQYPVDILKSAYIYGIYMAIWAVAGLSLALFQAFEEMKYNAFIWGASSFVNLGLSVFLLLRGGDFLSPIWGLTAGSLVSFLLASFFVFRRIKLSWTLFDFKFLKQNLKLAFPFALNSIFSSIYFRLDSIILSKLKSEQVMGWYGASYKLLDNLLMLPHFFLGAIYPTLCRSYQENKEKFSYIFSESLKVMGIGAFPIGIGLFLTAEKVILFLYGQDFVNGVLSLKILSFALLLIFFSSLGVVSLMSLGRMKLVNIVGIANVFINASLSFWLISDKGLGWSLNGAAVSTLVCELVAVIVFSIYFKKEGFFKRNLLADLGKPILASIFMGIAVYLSLSLNLMINVLVGVVVFVGIMFLINGFEKRELDLIKGSIKKK